MKQLTKLPSKNYLNLRYSFQNSLSKLSSHDTLENVSQFSNKFIQINIKKGSDRNKRFF